jgi:DNA-binding NarL/FixJ family response regulator
MTDVSRRLRVLIADDHPVLRFGLRALLSAHPDMEVVGDASSREEAVELARQLAPDVVLMDLNMPGISGIDATRAILSAAPETAILIVTMVDDDSSLFAAMRAGARRYLLKGADGDETCGRFVGSPAAKRSSARASRAGYSATSLHGRRVSRRNLRFRS